MKPKEHSKKAIRLSLIMILALLGIVLSMQPVTAISLGVSPGRVSFNDLLREGYAERTIRITTNSDTPLSGHYEVGGELKDWLSFEPNSTAFTISRTSPYSLKIIIRPPADTRSGSYSGSINIVTDHFGNVTSRAGGMVQAAVKLLMDAEVSDEETISCTAGGFSIGDQETGLPLELGFTISNKGNVRIAPEVTYEVWDQLQEELVLVGSVTSDSILPTVEQRMTKLTETHDLAVGQYWARMIIEECGASDTLTFSIVEPGGISDQGVLERITNKAWTYVYEPVEIRAVFRNAGPRLVDAQFKGTVKLEDEVIEVLESEELQVDPGESIDLITYFTPDQAGRYTVNGRVHYNKKITFEKGSIINVNYYPDEETEKSTFKTLPLIIYLVLLLTIFFMVRKILREKKKHSRKHPKR